MSLTFLKTWWLHHKRCSPRVEYKTMPFPETGLTLKVVPQIIFSLCSQISASSPWMHQGARCWSDSSPAVSGIWCNAYCNSHISCAASDAPARALFPPQPCASRERPSHEVYLFIYNLHSSSEHPFTSRWEGAVILLKIVLSLLALCLHPCIISIGCCCCSNFSHLACSVFSLWSLRHLFFH